MTALSLPVTSPAASQPRSLCTAALVRLSSMTRSEYHRLAPTFNRRQLLIDQAIDRIPQNVNRAGRHYKKLLKQIHEQF